MTQPGSITYGSSFSTPPVLKTVDQYGNPSTTGLPGTYTVTAAHSAGSGALVGTTTYNIGTAGSNGVITFTDLKINAAGAGNQLTATAAGYGSPVAGMAVWLDANDDTTVTASGGQVTAWNDKSGNGRNFTAQGPGTAAYGYSTQSGLTTRRIVAFNNKEVKNTSFNYTGSTLSMFAVFRRTGATFNYPIITSTYNGSANDYQSTGSYSLDLGPGQNTARLVRNEGACADAVASAADYSTQYYVASSVFTGTQNTLWINGTSMGNGGCVGAFNILGTSLGAGLDGSGNIRGASQSEVAEMLIYTSALSTVDRQAIETYLNNKWQTGASLPNLSATTLSFTVDPAPLSITASNQSKTYGQTLTLGPGSTAFSSAGLVSGDAIGSVTMAVDNNGDLGTAPVGAGYTLTPSAPTGGAFSAANYSITYTNGILTVNPAALSITATNQSKTYGQTVTFGSGSAAFISAGLQNGETIGSVTLACSGGAATAPVSGSPYAITPSDAIGGTFATNNYNITYIPGALTISPAPAGVTVSSSLNPSGLGDSVTLTAAVTPSDASGDVVFKANGTPLGTNTLSIGTATNLTATLLRGTNTITAEYSGDGNYLASAGALSGGQVVTNHPPTATAGTNDCTAALSVAIQITGLGGLAGDSDGDALAVTATIPSLGTNYIVTSGGTNYIYYQNTNGAAGTDLFDYTVDDGYGGLATNTITINVVVPNSESQNRLASPETIGAGPEVRLRFQGIPTYNYALEWTHDLTPATTWIPLSTNTADGAGLVIYTNTPLGPDYYRARRVP
jgi:hypothetical protein